MGMSSYDRNLRVSVAFVVLKPIEKLLSVWLKIGHLFLNEHQSKIIVP